MILAETGALPQLFSPLWLMVAVVLCLPVCIAVFWRIGRWWITDQPVPPPLQGALPPVRWPVWVGLLLFLGMYSLTPVISMGYRAAAEAHLLPWEPLSIPDILSPGIFLGQILPPLAAIALVTSRFGRGAAGAAGVRLGNPQAGVRHGVVAFAAMLPVCIAALLATAVLLALLHRAGLVPELIAQHPVLERVRQSRDPWELFLLVVQAFIVAPVAEEFVYRGVLMMTLLKEIGIIGALALSSVIFAVVHLPSEPQAVISLFLLGMALGYIAYRTRSLLAPIIAHALFNGLMIFGTLFGSP